MLNKKPKSVLLTGAAGFIGFHASLALKKRGDKVIGIDNFNPYYSPELKRKRAAILQDNEIEMIEADLNDKEKLHDLLNKHAFTHVLHLAAQAGVRYSKEHPEAYLSSNINGFLSILELLRKYPRIRLVYASSSSVYGRNTKTPFSIQDSTDKPANLYAVTKKANELMAYSYHHLYGICSTGLRFFTVYGPWGRPDMAYFSFTKAILEGQTIRLYNQGQMKRDFTYVDDVVQGTLAALDKDEAFGIYNLGNNQPVELLEFISILENQLGIKAKTRLEAFCPGEVETTFAEITESKNMLGFEPKTSLETGLKHFIQWYRSYKV